jgi:hypothetical protein
LAVPNTPGYVASVRVIEGPAGDLSFVDVANIGGIIEKASGDHHCSKAPSRDAQHPPTK